MIIDIRGTHGSGKSFVPIQILKNHYHEITDDGYLVPELDLTIISHYRIVCGGCDLIGKQDEVCVRVERAIKQTKYVMLEGILVAHTFSRWDTMAKQIPDWKFLFLDTPKQTCIDRVLERRAKKGNTKPFNTKNLEHGFRQIIFRVAPRLWAEGHDVFWLSHSQSCEQVMKVLSTGGTYFLTTWEEDRTRMEKSISGDA